MKRSQNIELGLLASVSAAFVSGCEQHVYHDLTVPPPSAPIEWVEQWDTLPLAERRQLWAGYDSYSGRRYEYEHSYPGIPWYIWYLSLSSGWYGSRATNIYHYVPVQVNRTTTVPVGPGNNTFTRSQTSRSYNNTTTTGSYNTQQRTTSQRGGFGNSSLNRGGGIGT